jgi:hypothetical protein
MLAAIVVEWLGRKLIVRDAPVFGWVTAAGKFQMIGLQRYR